MLNTTEVNFFKTALEARKKKIEHNLSSTSIEMNEMRRNELKDEGDHAAMSLETAVDNAILGQQSKELAEIELALGKMKKNLYGICEMCEEEINIERLKVKNFARFCITCREVVEKEQR
jgi:DnaK suppressor protein